MAIAIGIHKGNNLAATLRYRMGLQPQTPSARLPPMTLFVLARFTPPIVGKILAIDLVYSKSIPIFLSLECFFVLYKMSGPDRQHLLSTT